MNGSPVKFIGRNPIKAENENDSTWIKFSVLDLNQEVLDFLKDKKAWQTGAQIARFANKNPEKVDVVAFWCALENSRLFFPFDELPDGAMLENCVWVTFLADACDSPKLVAIDGLWFPFSHHDKGLSPEGKVALYKKMMDSQVSAHEPFEIDLMRSQGESVNPYLFRAINSDDGLTESLCILIPDRESPLIRVPFISHQCDEMDDRDEKITELAAKGLSQHQIANAVTSSDSSLDEIENSESDPDQAQGQATKARRGKAWTQKEVNRLFELRDCNKKSWNEIAEDLGRSKASVSSKYSELIKKK